ncbi:hypothetical protein ABVT39_008570 [Epinephelus coioides]
MPLKDQSNSTVAMKPAVDEMFPEGAGPYVDLDEILRICLTMMTSSDRDEHVLRVMMDDIHTT